MASDVATAYVQICKPQNLVRQISQGIFSFYAELNLPDTVW